MDFDKYFSFNSIVSLLCKYRATNAKKNHQLNLLTEVSTQDNKFIAEEKDKLKELNDEFKDLLPPRREWIFPNFEQRKVHDTTIKRNKQAILNRIKSVKHQLECKKLDTPPIWYSNLLGFVDEINRDISDPEKYTLSTPHIFAQKKSKDKTNYDYRAIASYKKIKDRIFISQISKYLTKSFDQEQLECSYAFRSRNEETKKHVTHHDAVIKIIEYRKLHADKTIWVSECDIKGFYDCINHKVVSTAFMNFVTRCQKKGAVIDQRAIAFFKIYLNSYAFNFDILPKNEDGWFSRELGKPNGRFVSNFKELGRKFKINKNDRIGVPQGGAISCLISNLVLDFVDNQVVKPHSKFHDPELLYVRYCDDMILMHHNKDRCISGLRRYKLAITKSKLLYHKPVNVIRYPDDFWGNDSKSVKSKAPFPWDNIRVNETAMPWVAFVGYNIRYDGLVRIRKNSLSKEIDKQDTEAIKIRRVITHNKKKGNKYISHKKKSQILNGLENKLISMSIGRVNIRSYKEMKPLFCWASGFKVIDHNDLVKYQMKRLDRNRGKVLLRMKKWLRLNLRSGLLKEMKKSKRQPKYYGFPFSYYAVLDRNKTA